MMPGLTRTFDDASDDVDPVLREIVAVVPFGVTSSHYH